MPTFKSKSPDSAKNIFDSVSISIWKGEKSNLVKELNKLSHPYSSFSHFVRASINSKVKSLGGKFKITEI